MMGQAVLDFVVDWPPVLPRSLPCRCGARLTLGWSQRDYEFVYTCERNDNFN